jgi:signal transduction histidine kinase
MVMIVFSNMSWKPSTVSWLSFLLMGLIVAGIGLSGTAHVVNYLHERLTDHDVGHNREIATALITRLESSLQEKSDDVAKGLSSVIKDYEPFGFRIILLDSKNKTLIADSGQSLEAVIPISESWLRNATSLSGASLTMPYDKGSALVIGDTEHPLLMWMQEMELSEPGRWVLGVAKDQGVLSSFMDDLHWHLDTVLLITYILITLLGYYAMRRIGRTYERRLEQQVSERTRALENMHSEMLMKTRLATIGQTASVLAHEMRNPLASINLALSGLSNVVGLQEREQRRMELVLGEVDRLDGMLSQTLDYVRPIKLSADPVDISQLLDHVIKQQEPVMEEKRITMRNKSEQYCPAITVDKELIHQVVLNLVKNAVEATPKGGEIDSCVSFMDKELKVEICNQGDPLSSEIIERAFEPFFTTKSKGTGLGLGLVKRVVEEHGGTVFLKSDIQTGICVTVTLPILQT